MAYNVLAPTPLSGSGAFGQVPGLIPTPQPAQDLGAQFPNLSGINAAMSQNLQAGLAGQVSPASLNALRSGSAAWGWASGMPGLDLPGSLNWHNLYGNIAGFAENQAQKAMENYSRLIPTISQTQTVSPTLQAELAAHNALNLAAPNPQAAASYAQSLFDKYLGRVRGAPSMWGGTGGFGPSGPAQPSGPTTGRFYDPNAPTPVGRSFATDTLTGGMPTGPAATPWYGNLQAGGPGTGTGQAYTGSFGGYDPNMPDLDTASDDQLLAWLNTPSGSMGPQVAGLPFAPPTEPTPYRGVEYSGVTPYVDPRTPTGIGGTGSAYNFGDIMGIDPSRRAAADVGLGQQLYGSDASLDAWAEDVGI